MKVISSFFDSNFCTPKWLTIKFTRRNALKSAAGAVGIAIMPLAAAKEQTSAIQQAILTEPWRTLDAVLNHLLPASPSGPSAKELKATQYLYHVVHLQPTAQDEIDFIYQGVGWLNSYTQSQVKQNFIELSHDNKEAMLSTISDSRAGQNWLNNLINYLYEAMLSPPIYGGNPNGIGWQWLEHQAGFPLPKEGDRYYELPGQHFIPITLVPQKSASTSTLSSLGKKAL